MQLKAFVSAAILVSLSTLAQAQAASDPLFGDDPHARAVLDCHANYALRYAGAINGVRATPTEVATAAYAHCAAQFSEFSRATMDAAKSSENPKAFMDPEKYLAEQTAKMRDYSFAYTLDTYLKQTTQF